MSLTVNSGPKALYLYFTQPFNAVDIDDDSTTGTLQVADVSIRDDLQGLKVWISETSGFTPAAGNLVFDAGFQSIVPLTDLKNNTTYYIKYAFVSKIDPDEYTTSTQVTATTLDTALPISGFLNRDPIQIPTDSDGNNAVFTNATGTFVVYNLSTNVTGTAAVTYSVVSGSSVGGVSATIASTGVYTITGITDLVGTITLRAVYTNPQNSSETYSIDLVLNVSKQRPGSTAPIVLLTSTGQAFVKAKNNGTISPSTITFDATIANIAGATYTWYADGVLINGATSSTYTLSSFSNTSTKLIKVRVQSTIVATIDVFDQMTVYYLEEGSDALNVALVNENQTVTLNAAGTVLSGLPISSQMVVARGSTILTSGVTYSLVSSTNLTNPTINSSTGIISIPTITNFALDTASATFKATVGTAELTKTLSISIVQDGRAAVINIGTVTTASSGSNATVTNTVTDGGATNTIDISIPRGADGTNIDAQLTNDFHAIPTAADGTGGVYTGASTTIEVYKNGVLQTSGFTFYVSDLQNVKYRGTGDTSDRTGTGVTNGALTATSGTAVVNIVELSADSGYVDITAKQTSDGQLFTERFSLSRNKAGVIGNDAVIYEIRSNVNAITKASPDAGTDGAHTPSSINFKIYQTVGNNLPALTGGARLYYVQWNSPATEPPNTNAVLVPVTGLIPAVTIANNSDYTSVNIKLLYKNDLNSYTELDREEIGVVFKGDKGDSGTSVDIVFARGSSPPSLTGTGNPPNSSWSTSVSTAPGTGLLWSSTGYSNDGGTTWSWDTAVQVEGTTGGSGESVAEISAFTRTTSNLSSSTISGGSYNFSNKTLTVPTGGSVTWYAAIPAGTDPLWETRTTAAVTAPTTVDNTLSWSTPVKVAQDGYTPVKNIDYFDGASAITANLTNESHSIPVDRSGAPTSYIGAETEVSVEQAGSNITSSYTWTITASSNLDTTLQAHTSNQLNSSTQLRFAFTNSNTKATLQLMGPTVTSILVRFTGTRTNYPNIVKDFTMVSVKPDVSVLELSNDVHEFSATNAGLVSVFTGGSTSYSVKRNGVDESSSWTFTAQATAGITFSYSDTSGTAQSQNTTTAVNIYAAGTTTNRTISVTNLTTAFRTGSITVTASRTGYSNLVQTFSLSSILAGYTPVKNTDYFDGNNAKYWTIDKTASVLYKNAPDSATSGTYTSTVITGKYYDGNTGSTSGYLSIRDNDTGTYTSASNPYTLSPGAGTGLTSVGIALYSDSSRTTLVATAVIPIVFRGAAGQDSTVPGATGAQIYKVYKAHTSNSTAPAGIAVDGTTTTTNGATPSGWSTTPPTLDATNFVQWESDGKQPSGSTATTWSAPYLSYFKVNSLDAITATIGTFQSAPNGQQRTVISGSKILVYDSSNNIRVKIGDLT